MSLPIHAKINYSTVTYYSQDEKLYERFNRLRAIFIRALLKLFPEIWILKQKL